MRVLYSLRLVLFLAGVALVLLVGSDHTSGQDIADDECFDFASSCDVEGVSAILASTDSSEIDTFSSTSITLDLVDNAFGADVVTGLFLDDFNNQIDSNEGFDDGSGFAEADMSDGIDLGHAYAVASDHHVIDLLSGDDVLVGSTAVAVDAAAPDITSITPVLAKVGTSGQLTVNGFDLFDQFDGSVGVSQIPGVTWSPASASSDGTQIVLNYTIATNAATGDQNFFLATRFGQSNVVTFSIDDQTPVVSSVQPDQWQAGADTSITVSGTGFGACPTLQISGPGVSGFTKTSGSPTQVQGTVTVDASSTGGQATVTVTSDGDTCSGFHGPPGGPNNGSNTAEIQAEPAPIPNIMFQGQNVTGQTVNVVVGQQIPLTVQINSSLSVTQPSWTVSGTAIGGYTASKSSASIATPTFNQTSTTFYWVYSGSQPVTFKYCLSNNQCNQGTATFTVAGPPAVSVNPTVDDVTISTVTDCAASDPNNNQVQLLAFGHLTGTYSSQPLICRQNLSGTPGIQFDATVNQSSTSGTQGTFLWVQLISNDSLSKLTQTGPSTCSGSGLDTQYPADNGLSTDDSPSNNMLATQSEKARNFSATMYLMWDPTLTGSGSCKAATPSNASTCTSIPVPLGFIKWGFTGDAISTLDASQGAGSGGWQLACHNKNAGSFTPSSASQNSNGYPIWSGAATCN
jgi:hypothetical protein